MEADSCEGVKIDSVVRSNPNLHRGVTHKIDCGVENIPLLKSSTLVVRGVGYNLLSAESLSCFPLIFRGEKLIVTLVGVGNI